MLDAVDRARPELPHAASGLARVYAKGAVSAGVAVRVEKVWRELPAGGRRPPRCI